MAQEIEELKIAIKLNGVEGTVSSLGEFREVLRKAKEDLNTITGKEAFKQLRDEIGQAENKILDLTVATKKISGSQQAEALGKLGAGIASGFAAATAAVSLFGVKDKEVMKAAQDAQNLLTIALSIRGVVELRTGAAMTARLITERATTLATNATNAATKALYSTLAANPYGVILVVLGALVAAYYAWANQTDDTDEALKNLNKTLAESKVEYDNQVAKVTLLNKVLKDSNSSTNAKAGAYKELQKIVPTLNKLTLEEAQRTKVLNDYIQDQVKLIQLRGQAKALEIELDAQAKIAAEAAVKFDAKRVEKAIEGDKKIQEIQAKNVALLKLWDNAIRNHDINAQNSVQAEMKANTTAYNNRVKEIQATSGTLKQYEKVEYEILELEGKQAIIIENQNENRKKATKAAKDLSDAEKERKKQLELETQALIQYLKAEAQRLFIIPKVLKADETALKNDEKKLQNVESLIASMNEFKTIQELMIELDANLAGEQDTLNESYKILLENLQSFFSLTQTGSKTTQEELNKINQQIGSLLYDIEDYKINNEGIVSDEEIAKMNLLIKSFEKLKEDLTKTVGLNFDIEGAKKAFIDSALAANKLYYDPLKRNELELALAKVNATETTKKAEDAFIEASVAKQEEANKKEIDDLIAAGELGKDALTKLRKSFEDNAKTEFQTLQKSYTDMLVLQDELLQNSEKILTINEKLKKLSPQAKEAFILTNADQIAQEYGATIPVILRNEKTLAELRKKIKEKNFEEDKKYEEGITLMQADLKAQEIDIYDRSYKAKLVLLEKFLSKTVKAEEDAEDKIREKKKKRRAEEIQFLQTFSQLLSQTAQLYQEQQDLLLKKEEIAYKKRVEGIKQFYGENKEAQKLLLEAEQEYQRKKAEIEKRAAVNGLKFQLAQAIANGAAEVIKVADIPVLAVAVGAIAAYQIKIIRDQIKVAESMAMGGRIRKQMADGGLVTGPSHEYGGVMANGYNLEGGEVIINKNSAIQYTQLLSDINQSGGGKAITQNIGTSLMEERMIQALAKSTKEPIRAYVLQQEITSSQAISKRLDALSSI